MLLLSAPTPHCDAQTLRRAVSITAENDYFDFWRPPDQRSDDNYTQGVRIQADVVGMPSFIRKRFCAKPLACGSALEIGQEMYTPTDDAPRLLPGERPYAGWLYTRGSVEAASTSMRRILTTTLGVTGPPSLAAQAQMGFHRLVHGFRRPLGWSGQLPAEADFAVQGEADRYVSVSAHSFRWLDFTPQAHATLGTLRTAAGGGGRARVGFNLTHPWLREHDASRFEAYLLAGAQGEAVARDLFLDGTTFRHSAHVAREPFVGEWERGVGVRYAHLALEYRAVTTSREYVSGPVSHTFGGFAVSWWINPSPHS